MQPMILALVPGRKARSKDCALSPLAHLGIQLAGSDGYK